jgi:hypothetical protein
MFFSSGFAIIWRDDILFTTQNADLRPSVSALNMRRRAGDITKNLGPSTDFSRAANMPYESGFDNFLDSLMPRGFLSFFGSSESGSLGRPWEALRFFTSFSFILPPQLGQ